MRKKGHTRRKILISLASAVGIPTSGCVSEDRSEIDQNNRNESTEESVDSELTSSLRLPEVNWRFETGGEVSGGLVLSGGSIYFGSFDGYLYALEQKGETEFSDNNDFLMGKHDLAGSSSLDTGGPVGEVTQKWRFPTGGRIYTSPALSEGQLYFGSEDNYFYSVSADTGEESWKIDVGKRIGGGATVAGDAVYFGAGGLGSVHEGGSLHAVDKSNGSILWEREYSGGVQSPPIVSNGTIYHGCQDSHVYALDADTGDRVWRYAGSDNFCGCRPALRDGILYIGSEDNSMYALDADNGSLVWEFETGDIIVSSPVATEDAVYFGSYDDNLYAVEPDTGEELWSFDAGGSVFSSPAYRDGIVYFGTESGWLFAVDGRTGEEVWSIEQSADRHHAVSSSPVVTEDMVYFGTKGNSVYGVRNRSVSEREYEESETTVTIRNS